MTRGSYPIERIRAHLLRQRITSACRLIWTRHADNPLATRLTRSRFCDGKTSTVLYAAQSFETAFIEVIVRDRFVLKGRRDIPYGELALRTWLRLATRSDEMLNLLDLRGTGCVDIGAPTDTIHARNQAAGRALAAAIHSQHASVDGLVYPSRLTGADCFAVFARASSKLEVVEQGPVAVHDGLPDVLQQHNLGLIVE